MPNDEEEADRLDMLHEMILTTMHRKLFLAPIGESPTRVIDLGTGTGIWAIDFGKNEIGSGICYLILNMLKVISTWIQR